MISGIRRWPIWLRASQETPPVSDPSPTTAMTRWLLSGHVAGDGQAEGGRKSGRGVARVVRVVRALLAGRKAEKPALAAKRREPVAPPGDDFMGVGLMADVPDDLVPGSVEDPVKGEGDLDDAEVGGQMAAVSGNDVEDLGPDLDRQLGQFLDGKPSSGRPGR